MAIRDDVSELRQKLLSLVDIQVDEGIFKSVYERGTLVKRGGNSA